MQNENLSIVFVDIAGYTARTSAQTREQNEAMLRRFEDTVRPLVRAFDGRVIKSIGDAFLSTFRSPTDALLSSIAIHDRLAETDAESPEHTRFKIRAAINVGEVRVEGGDVFGEAVNIAARIEGQAPAGDVVFSEAVYLSMTRSEVPSEEIGYVDLKGIPEPVRLYRIPRAAEGSGYSLQSHKPSSTTAASGKEGSRLEPTALPFGGLGLNRVRERLARPTLTTGVNQVQALLSGGKGVARGLAAKLSAAWQWWRREVRRSKKVRIASAVLALLLACLLVWGIVAASTPKPKPLTPWQRLQRSLGG